MDLVTAFDKLVKAHGRYYDLNTETPAVPFLAEAAFLKHDVQYFLTKKAKITEYDTGEYVFFKSVPKLSAADVNDLAESAWSILMDRVKPSPTHRNTDAVVYIVTEDTEFDVAKAVMGFRRYRSYRFGLHGFSHLKLVVYDLSSGNAYYNRVAHDRKKIIDNIFSKADQ